MTRRQQLVLGALLAGLPLALVCAWDWRVGLGAVSVLLGCGAFIAGVLLFLGAFGIDTL